MQKLILSELKTFHSDDFYISENIPTKKTNNAKEHYPIDNQETILGLIDSTVFGSAKTGMAIGIKGLYWKNDWATESTKSFLSWEELLPNADEILYKGSNLILTAGCKFNLSGSQVKPSSLAGLIKQIINSLESNQKFNSEAECKKSNIINEVQNNKVLNTNNEEQIASVINDYQYKDLYTKNDITADKLNNVHLNYPIPSEEKILGIIDNTILGSAKKGMVFGLKGIYWQNDWTTKSQNHSISWTELLRNNKTITHDKNTLILSKHCLIDFAISDIKPPAVIEIIHGILTHFQESTSDGDSRVRNTISEEVPKVAPKEVPKVASKEIPKKFPPFEGSYNKQLLVKFKEISKKYRLSTKIDIAPNIKVYKIKTILSICEQSIDPYSIFVLVDNTFLATAKDFLVITDQEIIAKATLCKVDSFKFSEIREVHREGKSLFINKHKFQFLDQLTEYEIDILIDYIQDILKEIPTFNSIPYIKQSISPHLNEIIELSYPIAVRELKTILNNFTNEEFKEIMQPILECHYAILTNIAIEQPSKPKSNLDTEIQQCIMAYIIVCSFSFGTAFNKKRIEEMDDSVLGFFSSINHSILKAVTSIAANKSIPLNETAEQYNDIISSMVALPFHGKTIESLGDTFISASIRDQEIYQSAKLVFPTAAELMKNIYAE